MDLDDDFEIPPELREEWGAGGGGAGAGGAHICPHCTFENDHSGDCDVCGLPM